MLIFESSSKGRSATAQYEKLESVDDISELYLRKDGTGLPEGSELQVVRHFTNLSKKNFSIDGQVYP